MRTTRGAIVAGAALALAACGGGPRPAPGPETTNTLPPDLRGRTVMVLPVQATAGVAGDADAELAFALRARGGDVTWVFPAELERALERSPGLDARTRGLSVGVFLSREVERVGDPLYGTILRLSSLVDGEVALIPVQVAPGPADAEGKSPLQVWTALIHVRSGRVLWFGVVAGAPGDAGDPSVLASAMDVLARRLLWYSNRRDHAAFGG